METVPLSYSCQQADTPPPQIDGLCVTEATRECGKIKDENGPLKACVKAFKDDSDRLFAVNIVFYTYVDPHTPVRIHACTLLRVRALSPPLTLHAHAQTLYVTARGRMCLKCIYKMNGLMFYELFKIPFVLPTAVQPIAHTFSFSDVSKCTHNTNVHVTEFCTCLTMTMWTG